MPARSQFPLLWGVPVHHPPPGADPNLPLTLGAAFIESRDPYARPPQQNWESCAPPEGLFGGHNPRSPSTRPRREWHPARPSPPLALPSVESKGASTHDPLSCLRPGSSSAQESHTGDPRRSFQRLHFHPFPHWGDHRGPHAPCCSKGPGGAPACGEGSGAVPAEGHVPRPQAGSGAPTAQSEGHTSASRAETCRWSPTSLSGSYRSHPATRPEEPRVRSQQQGSQPMRADGGVEAQRRRNVNPGPRVTGQPPWMLRR